MSDIIIRDNTTAHLEARVDTRGEGRIIMWNRETKRELPYGGGIRFELNDDYLCDTDRNKKTTEIKISSRDQNYSLFAMTVDGEELVHFSVPGSKKRNAQGSNLQCEDAWGVLELPVPKKPHDDFAGRKSTERSFIVLAVRKPSADPTLPQAILFDPSGGVEKEWPAKR